MNSKKKMVLGAALVVAMIALAGVGYATWSANFNGTTSTTAKTADVDFVKISLSSDNYTQTILPIETAIYWNTVTDNSGTTYRDPVAASYVYSVTIDKTSLENGDMLKLVVSGLTTTQTDYYALSATSDWGGTGTPVFDGNAGTFTFGGDEGTAVSDFDLSFTITVTLTPTPNTRTTQPATTALFPALVFTLEGVNVEAPSS